jgi:hypothetical protein
MDESTLQDRLTRSQRREYLILTLLIALILLHVAEIVGPWMTGVLGAMVGTVVFGLVVISRLRSRNTAGQ